MIVYILKDNLKGPFILIKICSSFYFLFRLLFPPFSIVFLFQFLFFILNENLCQHRIPWCCSSCCQMSPTLVFKAGIPKKLSYEKLRIKSFCKCSPWKLMVATLCGWNFNTKVYVGDINFHLQTFIIYMWVS